MTLFSFHVPPRGLGVSASVVTGPPAAGIFFRKPSAKNPMNWPSADQNGKDAPSVPSSFLADNSPSDCTQTESRSFWVRAQNTIAVPWELITGGPEKSPVKSKLICGGGGRNERKVRGTSRERMFDHTWAPPISKSARATHPQCQFRGASLFTASGRP